MSLEFVRKQEFKLKKIKKPIYIRNVNSFFNKEGPIEHMVKMNIYYHWGVKVECNLGNAIAYSL